MKSWIAAQALLVGITWSPQAMAGPADFLECDGYPAPSAKADSMTRDALFWGLAAANSDMRPVKIMLAEYRVAICDAALADPLLKPAFVLCRINLLHLKAMHQLKAGNAAAALQTLDEARALAPPGDPRLHRRGLGLANTIIRAVALAEANDKPQAAALIAEVRKERPYSSLIMAITDGVEARMGLSPKSHLEVLRRQAPLMPNAAFRGLLLSLVSTDFRRATEFGSGLTVELPRMRGGWTVEGWNEYELIRMRADIAGSLAYSLAALGEEDKAKLRLDRAQQNIFEAAAPPVPRRPGEKISRTQEADYRERKRFAEQAAIRLVAWQKLIDLRRNIPSMQPADVLRVAGEINTGSVKPSIDVLRQIRVPPQDETARAAAIAEGLRKLDADQRELGTLDLDELANLLPRAETLGNQPKFHRAGDGYFLSDNGFSQRKMDSDDKWTVRFTSALATSMAVDELAVLSAAQLAKRQGYDGFIIEAHNNIERTMHVTAYYSSRDVNSGRETLLTVRLVKGTQVPEDLAGAEWRIFNADSVISGVAGDYALAAP